MATLRHMDRTPLNWNLTKLYVVLGNRDIEGSGNAVEEGFGTPVVHDVRFRAQRREIGLTVVNGEQPERAASRISGRLQYVRPPA